MRAFLTGGTGFLGGRIAVRLRERGDDVVARVRARAKASRLEALGCELAEGDLSAAGRLAAAMEGCGAVVHAAAVYRNGVPRSQHQELWDANVHGTAAVLDAAAEAGVARVVYVSSNVVLGDTGGRVVDESYERPDGGFVSVYDETKTVAHREAVTRIAAGAPILIAQPGGVYGPGDHTMIGPILERAFGGKPVLLSLADVGLNWGYVEDIVAGIVLVLERGAVGETYILGGEIATLGEAVRKAYAAGGHTPRIVPVPTALIRLAIPLGPLLSINVRELVSAAGATYYGGDAKARRELGYAPAALEEGLRRAFAPAR